MRRRPWRAALESAATCSALEGSPESERVRGAMYARPRVLRHGFPRQWTERRLPLSEPMDARGPCASAAAGDGLDLWRRLCRRGDFRASPGRSKKGVVVVSMNYRLGIFGFFSHPELTKESGH